ncbi:MAG: hypothetical protein HOP22_15365 [Nitrospiraceae bacterium]|nr:hypothetical protein [Nitrospiraceae bacterium]
MQPIIWSPQQLRLTVFPDKLFDLPEPGWWVKLLGEPPEERKVKSKELSQVEQGGFRKGKLMLNITAARIDWTYTAPISDEMEIDMSMGMPTLGSFESALDDFRSIVGRWLTEMCPAIARMAFGAILLYPAENHEKGYELLGKYLPEMRVDPQGSSDLLYQINRPRVSKTGISELRINRLSKWGVLKAQVHLFSAGKGVIKDLGAFATRLELDINTNQDFGGELPQEKLNLLFEELIDLGREIGVKGDIA